MNPKQTPKEPPTCDVEQVSSESRALLWVRLGGLVVMLVIVGTAMIVSGADSRRSAIDEVADAGWKGVVGFVLLYAIATVLLVPGTATTATAGVVYGTVGGAAVAVVGATIGSLVAYGIARGAGRKPVQILLASRIADIDQWVAQRQFRSILVMRLLPVVPFNLFNYAAGLSPVRPTPYLAATAVGLVPGALLIGALGSAASQPTSVGFISLLAVFVAAMALSAVAARRWTRN